jgi:CDP-glycerol glycerophosphotransferase (TagB/SpsB family)
MTTPGLDVYQLKRAKTVKHYSHVLHMTSDPATYRLFGLDYFDSVLLTGPYQERDIRELEQLRRLKPKELPVVGCTYLDIYAEKIGTPASKDKNTELTILVSPSWGTSSLLTRYGTKLLDPLIQTGHHIIIRPHPQSKVSEVSMLENLSQRYRDKPNLEWDYERENIVSLSRADIMISDFSGIIFDYIFLCNKPVIYAGVNMDSRPYDASDLDHELWQTKTIRETGLELKEEDFPRIGEVIEKALSSTALQQARQKSKDEAWQYRGEAGKRIAEFMIEKAGIEGPYSN